jgi:surfeit locus 1 family protein
MLCGYFYLFVYIFGVHKNFHLTLVKPFLFSIILILTTFFLGVWQLKRLDWKNSLIKSFDNLQYVSAINIEDTKMQEFTKIKVIGTIDRNKKIFFPAKTNNGKAGIRLASELTLENGNKYLIDEGWFENSKYKYFEDNKDIFKLKIIGYVRYPISAKIFTPSNNLLKNEWYTYDLSKVSNFFSSSINQSFFIKKMNSNKEDYLLPSTYRHQFRNNHLQYSITWFCMSFAFFILFLVYLKNNKK